MYSQEQSPCTGKRIGTNVKQVVNMDVNYIKDKIKQNPIRHNKTFKDEDT